MLAPIPAGRFNERLVLSLASNTACLLMDDELNILPTSSHVKHIEPIQLHPDGTPAVPNSEAQSAAELKDLAASLEDTQVSCQSACKAFAVLCSAWSPRWLLSCEKWLPCWRVLR